MSTIAICSGKGSPGATFVALNLAASLARDADTLLIDLDPSGGDLAAYLGLDPRRGLFPLTRVTGATLSRPALAAEAQRRERLRIVAGFPDGCDSSAAELLPQILDASCDTEGFVVADLGRVSHRTPACVEVADATLIVVRPDLVSVAGAERALRFLSQAGISDERIHVVVNALERRRPADIAEVSVALGRPVIASIPLDRSEARAALLAQRPVLKGRIVDAMRDLGDKLRALTPASVGELEVPA